MVMTKGASPSMPSGNVPDAGSGEPVANGAPYDVPRPGNYPAPTPHAAAVAHNQFVAPEGDLKAMASTGLSMVDAHHEWTKTPGKS